MKGWPAPPHLWVFLVRWNERLEKRNETQRQSIEKEKWAQGTSAQHTEDLRLALVSKFPQYLLITIFTILVRGMWCDYRVMVGRGSVGKCVNKRLCHK